MSSEQRPDKPPHSQVPEIPQELLTARPLGNYEDVPPGESFQVYFENGPRFIEPGTGAVQDTGQHNTQRLTFHRLCEGESELYPWRLEASDGQVGVELEGSSTYLERDLVLGGVVKGLQYFSFVLLKQKELTVTAPDGDSLSLLVAEPYQRVRIGPIFCVKWPWGKAQVTNSDLEKKIS